MRLQLGSFGLLLWLLVIGGAGASESARPISDADLRSGRTYQSADIQATETDELRNPGLLWVEQGRQAWGAPQGRVGKSCGDCHGADAAAMRGVAARYPAVDLKSGKLLNIEGRINACRTERQGADVLAYETPLLLALTAYLTHLSKGQSKDVRIDGPAAPHFAAGRDLFMQRQGQLNLACTQCHDQSYGKRLRGDRISQGHASGYPAYRLEWQSLGSLHRRLQACSRGVRAEIYEAGSPEYLALELYLAWRAGPLPIDAPGVRR